MSDCGNYHTTNMDEVVVFESTQVALSVQFQQLMPSNLDHHSFFLELAEKLDLTFCEQIDNGCPVFVGLWDNVQKTEAVLKTYLRSWESNSQLSSKSINKSDKLATNNDKESVITIDSSVEIPITTETSVVSSTEADLVNDYGLFITDYPQLFVVTNEVDETYPDFVQCAVSDTQSNFVNPKKEEKNKIDSISGSKKSSKVNEIYVDIAINDKRRKSTNNIIKGPKQHNNNEKQQKITNQNSLDKLCKLLCIGEDEAIEKRMSKSEYKRRYEDGMPFKYFCQDCSFKTKRETHFEKHLKLHEKIKVILSCDQCDFKTIRESVLCQHKMNHAPTKHTCKVCPFKTNKLARLKYHAYNVHGLILNKSPVNCHSCDFTTSTKLELRKHRHLVHSNEKRVVIWKCTECPYKSAFRSHLKRHQSDVHTTGSRPFLCHYCGMRFKRNDTLTQHKLIHGEVKKIYNCEKCGRKFNRLISYQSHMVKHSDQRPFLCDMCGMSFKTLGSTRRHKKTVHLTTGVFSCPFCDKKYKSKAGRDKHKKSHSGESTDQKAVEVVEETGQEEYIIKDDQANIQIVFTGSEQLKNKEIVI